jgi:glycosyltransferase involved in cell wall biosynthesis
MRIAYMLPSLGMGGAERQVVALAERMAARGHTVALIVLLPRQPEEWPATVEAVCLEMRRTPAGLLAGLARGRRCLRNFQPDLIHSHVYPANMAARLIRLLSLVRFRPATPLISTVHSVKEGAWPRLLAYGLTDPLSRLTTFVSHTGAVRSVRLKAVPASKSSVITNGIDTAEFAPKAECRARLRAEMGAGGEFVWLAAGRIVPAKDYPNLLRAFAWVQAPCPEAQLWIAGEAQGEEFAAIQALAAELGLGASVRWLGLRRDMAALMDAADGFVLASSREGMPLVVGEAMAMEKPVVATDVGGVRELVGEAGVLVPAKSPETLGQAMLGMMQSAPETRRKLGRAARERITANFNIEAKANEWEALYRAVLEKMM